MKILYLTLIFICFCVAAFAQDKIYKKGGEILEVKITEVGSDEIKYKMFNDQDGPTYALDKDRILKVVYKNGRSESYQSNLKDPELYADQSKDALKVNFLSPLFGFTQLNYEHSLRPGRAYELSLGIIGLGKKQELGYRYDLTSQTSTTTYRQARGLFFAGGYKYSKASDFVNRNSKYSHVLQGTYVKPELSLGVYSQNKYVNRSGNANQTEKETVVFSGLLINLGKQWVLGDALLIDLYGGLGYAFDNRKTKQDDFNEGYNYENTVGNHFALVTGAESGLGFTGGFKVGLLINSKKK